MASFGAGATLRAILGGRTCPRSSERNAKSVSVLVTLFDGGPRGALEVRHERGRS